MLSSDLCQENASVPNGPTSLTTQRHHTPPAHRTVKTSTDQNIQSCHRPWLLSWHKWTWFFRTPFKWSLNKWLKFHISCSAPRSSIIASCVAHVLALYLSSFIDIQLCTVSSNFQLAITKFRNHVCPGSRWACTYSGRLSPSHPEIVLCSLAHVFKTSTFMTSNVIHDTFTSSSKLPLHVRYWSDITCFIWNHKDDCSLSMTKVSYATLWSLVTISNGRLYSAAEGASSISYPSCNEENILKTKEKSKGYHTCCKRRSMILHWPP